MIGAGQGGTAPERPTAGDTGGKRKGRRTGTDAPEPTEAQPPDRARHLVDVDPWAILLEQLTEVPEESVPAERKGRKAR